MKIELPYRLMAFFLVGNAISIVSVGESGLIIHIGVITQFILSGWFWYLADKEARAK